MTLELSAVDEASVRRIMARLVQSGLSVDKGSGTAPGTKPAASAKVVLTVRAS
jgi:hypothetical protein